MSTNMNLHNTDVKVEVGQHKDELIEKYHDINVDNDWWEYTYGEFKLDMLIKGITVNDINFSGFYSQGDGASFTGRIDMIQFLKVHNLEQEYMAATFFAEQGELWGEIGRKNHRYSHENSVDVNLIEDTYNNYEENSTRHQVYETMFKVLELEWKDLNEQVNKICRGYMQDLYRQLRDEYEYLTSKEVIWETIVANDLHVLETA